MTLKWKTVSEIFYARLIWKDSLQQQIYSLENEKSQLQTKFDQTVYKLLNSISEKSAESMLEIAASINQIKESQLIIEGKVTHVKETSSQIQSG